MARRAAKLVVGDETFDTTISRERLRQLRKNAEGKCSVAGCERKAFKSGYCRKDYAAQVAAASARYAARAN